MTDTLTAVLDGTAIDPEAPALTDPQGRTLTHRQLDERVRAVATGLIAHGLQPGERMLFFLRPSAAGICLALGCVAAGGTVMFADPGAAAGLFASQVQLAAPSWAAAESLQYAVGRPGPGQALARRRGLILPDLAGLAVRHIHSGTWLPGVPRSALSLRRLLGTTPLPRAELPAPHEDQQAAIVFSSGSAAEPRAVAHTRKSLGAALDLASTVVPLAGDDMVLTDQFLMGLPTLAAGAHWRLPPFGFSPRADARTSGTVIGDATVLFAVPADLAAIAAAVGAGDSDRPASLRAVVTGGAPVSASLIRAAESLVPADDLVALYGMAEILPVAATTGRDILDFQGSGYLVGAPLTGVFAHTAEDGELRLSGPHLAAGLRGGRRAHDLPTGDLARFDAGRLVLQGRKHDVLMRGSTTIYPALSEPTIAGLPGVADCAIVGVPDGSGDVRVVLLVQPERDSPGAAGDPVVSVDQRLADQVTECLPGLIDAAAIPDRVLVLSELPRTGRGAQLDRAELRRIAAVALAADATEASEAADDADNS